MPLVTAVSLALVLAQQAQPQPLPPTSQAQLRTWYRIGDPGNELDFFLDSAKIDHYYAAKEDNYVAGEGQKLINFRFKVKNPQKSDVTLSSSSFSFMASADDENFEFRGYLLNTATTLRRSGVLESGDTANCSIILPAKFRLDMVKMRVKRGSGEPLRFDLTGKMVPLISTFAAAQGKNISTTPQIEVVPGQQFDVAPWMVKFKGIEYTRDKIRGYEPQKDHEYLVAQFRFTNMMQLPVGIGHQYFAARLAAWSGKEIAWNHLLLVQGGDDMVSQELQKGGWVDAFYYFEVPTNAPELGFSLTDVNSKRSIPFTVPARG